MAKRRLNFVFNPASETVKVIDDKGVELIQMDSKEALWMAELILRRFRYEIKPVK